MARNGNSFKSFEPWRDFSSPSKNEAPGTSLSVSFQVADNVKALTEIPDMRYSASDLLHFLQPDQIQQHSFTQDDVALMEKALKQFFKLPMPEEQKSALVERWTAYRRSLHSTAQPAPAAPAVA